MNTTELKRKTLAEAIRKHQSVLDDFRAGITTLLDQEPVVNEDEVDYGDQSKTSEAIITQVNPLGDQLEFANNEMKLLRNLQLHQDDQHDRVELGSIVVTDKRTFFVSASIEEFDVDGKSVFGLSTKTPLYRSMEVKAGWRFLCLRKDHLPHQRNYLKRYSNPIGILPVNLNGVLQKLNGSC